MAGSHAAGGTSRICGGGTIPPRAERSNQRARRAALRSSAVWPKGCRHSQASSRRRPAGSRPSAREALKPDHGGAGSPGRHRGGSLGRPAFTRVQPDERRRPLPRRSISLRDRAPGRRGDRCALDDELRMLVEPLAIVPGGIGIEIDPKCGSEHGRGQVFRIVAAFALAHPEAVMLGKCNRTSRDRRDARARCWRESGAPARRPRRAPRRKMSVRRDAAPARRPRTLSARSAAAGSTTPSPGSAARCRLRAMRTRRRQADADGRRRLGSETRSWEPASSAFTREDLRINRENRKTLLQSCDSRWLTGSTGRHRPRMPQRAGQIW
jgi:hypothetical protein